MIVGNNGLNAFVQKSILTDFCIFKVLNISQCFDIFQLNILHISKI